MKLLTSILNFATKRKNSFIEDIILCIGITLASGFYFYENFYPLMPQIRLFLLVFLLCVWFGLAFKYGIRKKYSFLIFAALYWQLPYAVMVAYSMNDNVRHYSKLLTFLNKTAVILVQNPLNILNEKLGTQPFVTIVIVLLFTLSLYILGSSLSGLTDFEAKGTEDKKIV